MNARRLTSTCCATLLGLAAGCFDAAKAPPAREKEPAAAAPAPGPVRVRSDGACLQLGELQQPTVTPDALAAKVAELLAAGRNESARRYVLRFPDVAEELLRSSEPARAGDPAVVLVAVVQDAGRVDKAWEALLHDLAGSHRAYAAKRAEAAANLRAGKPEPVVKANLPALSLVGLTRLDALRLHGQALLLTDRPKDAAAAFAEAAKLADGDAHQAAQCLLLLGECQRRAGLAAESKATWARAVEAAARLLDRPEPVIDPGLWERAAYLKPVDANWPEPVIRSLVRVSGKRVLGTVTAGSTTPETWVWVAAGVSRMDRGELHAALAAFKRAETMTTDPAVRDGLSVAQARVLLLLGQPQPASSVLVPITAHSGSPHAASAAALLGALKLSDGAGDQALTLLRRAVENTTGEWPGRAEAEADLGLAYLSAGDAGVGLKWLVTARAKFQADGEIELLLRSWDNEARYWESQGRTADAAAARGQIRAIEQGGMTTGQK